MSEQRKSGEAQELDEAESPSDPTEDEELGEEVHDFEQMIRDAQSAVLQKRQEQDSDEPEADPVPEKPAVVETVAEAPAPEPDEGLKQKLEALESQLGEKDEELLQLRDRLLRLAAEFDNFKKRSRKERGDLVQFANEELLKQFLPVLDNFDRALESGRQQSIPEAFFKGIELIYSQANNILERIGLKHLEVVGQPFDPNLHEAVMRDPNSELPENAVVQELRRGYMLHDKIIRQAMVSVSARSGTSSTTKANIEPNPNVSESSAKPETLSAESDSAASENQAPAGDEPKLAEPME